MIQDVLTYLLIASATAYILFSLYRLIYPPKNAIGVGCPGCGGGCKHENSNTEKAPSKISLPLSYSSDSGSVPDVAVNKGWVPRDFASSDLANRLQ